MTPWEAKGCPICRNKWLSGQQLTRIATNDETHSFLHKCDACGTYWQQFERYANVISKDEAQAIFGEAAVED
ncbi:MAG: hypothetical protein KJ000_36275 [Pirellulaceae bacterium]|nr:hypothetical protein [Pirellulaceae bacterium]